MRSLSSSRDQQELAWTLHSRLGWRLKVAQIRRATPHRHRPCIGLRQEDA